MLLCHPAFPLLTLLAQAEAEVERCPAAMATPQEDQAEALEEVVGRTGQAAVEAHQDRTGHHKVQAAEAAMVRPPHAE